MRRKERKTRDIFYLSRENHYYLQKINGMIGMGNSRFLNAVLEALRTLPTEDSYAISRQYFEKSRIFYKESEQQPDQTPDKPDTEDKARVYRAFAEVFEVLYMGSEQQEWEKKTSNSV